MGALQVPEPVTDLRLVLDCEPEQTETPQVEIADGVHTIFTNDDPHEVDFNVSDDVGEPLVGCAQGSQMIGGDSAPGTKPCESPLSFFHQDTFRLYGLRWPGACYQVSFATPDGSFRHLFYKVTW